MKVKKFYFDSDEEGPAIETSHPNFNAIVKEEFYYDCTDDFSPFGNDDGADALASLEEWYQETRGRGKITNWLFRYIDGYGFKFKSKWTSTFTDLEKLAWLEKEDPAFTGCMDRAIIGTGFGQYKIVGVISKELKEIVLAAIARQRLIHEHDLLSGKHALGNIDIDSEGDKQLMNQYLERLATMESDLNTFIES